MACHTVTRRHAATASPLTASPSRGRCADAGVCVPRGHVHAGAPTDDDATDAKAQAGAGSSSPMDRCEPCRHHGAKAAAVVPCLPVSATASIAVAVEVTHLPKCLPWSIASLSTQPTARCMRKAVRAFCSTTAQPAHSRVAEGSVILAGARVPAVEAVPCGSQSPQRLHMRKQQTPFAVAGSDVEHGPHDVKPGSSACHALMCRHAATATPLTASPSRSRSVDPGVGAKREHIDTPGTPSSERQWSHAIMHRRLRLTTVPLADDGSNKQARLAAVRPYMGQTVPEGYTDTPGARALCTPLVAIHRASQELLML